MFDASTGLALSAGVLAAVNPCGFALLPAYVSLLVVGADKERPAPLVALGRALTLTAAMTAGFVAVFGVFGLLAAPAADWLSERLPWLTVAIGVVLTGLGLWLAAGRELPSPIPKINRAPALRRQFGSMILFGMSFAIASLGCTIGPFLGVVVASFTAGSAAQGSILFLAYAAGMALVVGTVAVAVAIAQQSVVTWIRRATPVISRVAGVLMVLAGLYVAWYGWYEIRIRANPNSSDPIIDNAGDLQIKLSTFVDGIGATGAGIALALMVAAIGALAWLRQHRRRT